jgi:hypothetical protein
MVFDNAPTDLGIAGNSNFFMEASIAFESVFRHNDDVPSLKSSDGGSDDGDVDLPIDRRSAWQQEQQQQRAPQHTFAEQGANGAAGMAAKAGLKVFVERVISTIAGAVAKVMGGGSEEDDVAAILSSTQAKDVATTTATAANESSRNMAAGAFFDPGRYVVHL